MNALSEGEESGDGPIGANATGPLSAFSESRALFSILAARGRESREDESTNLERMEGGTSEKRFVTAAALVKAPRMWMYWKYNSGGGRGRDNLNK